MTAKKQTGRKKVQSKGDPIPVRFSSVERQKIRASAGKAGVGQAEVIRIGAWMLAQMKPADVLAAKLRYVAANS